MIKKLTLYIAFLCFLSCSKTETVPYNELYHGKNIVFKEVAKQLSQTDEGKSIIKSGVIEWDSTIASSAISNLKKLDLIIPIKQFDGRITHLTLTIDNNNTIQGRPEVHYEVVSFAVLRNKQSGIKEQIQSTASGDESNNDGLKVGGEPSQLMSLSSGECEVLVNLRAHYTTVSPNWGADLQSYWANVATEVRNVLGLSVNVSITTGGLSIQGFISDIMPAVSENFWMDNHIGYAGYMANMNISEFEMFSPQVTCFEGSGGGGSSPLDPRDTEEIQAFENDYKDNMSAKELTIYNSMSRVRQLDYLMNAFTAINEPQSRFSGMAMTDSKADAFRHAYFSLLNVQSLGLDLAEKLGTAHEDGGNNSALARSMDLFNNQVGRTAYHPVNIDSSYWNIFINTAMSLLNNGSLRYIHNGQLIPTNQ